MARAFILVASLISLISAQTQRGSTFTPARPPSIPLFVRSPYLSTWTPAGPDGGNGGYLAGQWPQFWTGSINGWCGLIQVDGQIYNWMGNPDPLPQLVNQTSFEYTSTRSTFIMDVAGAVTLNITFLSPVDPTDKQRQGMPVAYMNIAVQSADGDEHDVSVYTDISAEWVSGDRGKTAQWSRGTAQGSSNAGNGDLAFHRVWRQTQQEFSEDNDQAAWGYWYYATQNVDGLTYQSGADTDVRKQFTDNGRLDNSEDNNFRAINDRFPVFAFAVDLGSVSQDPQETRFTMNLLQQNCVQFTTSTGTNPVPCFWTNFFSDELSAITTFYYDYDNAVEVTSALDASVAADAQAVGGDDYVTIVSLAVRQAFGAVQFAGMQSDNYLFLKEISSNGNFQTVDVIFPFHPILLYMNASWLKNILDPLFINQETPGMWPENFAIHDIGTHYPNATGHADGRAALQPLEECGNMLIMSLVYAQRTGDTAYLDQHWPILDRWAQWLISNNSVIPFNQISTDDFAGPLANQTNLALKGIIGLEAASIIANLTNHPQASSDYSNTAHDWIRQWEQLAVNQNANPPHTVLNYNDEDSYSLLYNLYADSLLQTNLVPQSIYTMQSDFYPTIALKYGVPLDTRATRTKNDWEMFCAAIASEETMQLFNRLLASFINETPTSVPVTDLQEAGTGDLAYNVGPFRARPVVGGWFAALALKQVGIPGGSNSGSAAGSNSSGSPAGSSSSSSSPAAY